MACNCPACVMLLWPQEDEDSKYVYNSDDEAADYGMANEMDV